MSLPLDPAVAERLQAACTAINETVARKRQRLWIGAMVALGISALSLAFPPEARMITVVGAWLLVVITGVVMSAGVTREYKAALAIGVVPLIRPGLSFHPTGSIGRREFNALGLFANSADDVKAADELRGEHNGVGYSVQELKATYTTTTHNGKSTQRHTHTIFRGLVARLEFHKHFHGHTVIVPEYLGSSLFGGLFGSGTGEPVSLENAAFEERFVVRSTDQQEARYLITPKFMEVVVEAEALLGDRPRLAFHGDELYVFISSSADRFEASLFSGVRPEKAVAELNEVIRLAERLIAAFDLETRIWTRA